VVNKSALVGCTPK